MFLYYIYTYIQNLQLATPPPLDVLWTLRVSSRSSAVNVYNMYYSKAARTLGAPIVTPCMYVCYVYYILYWFNILNPSVQLAFGLPQWKLLAFDMCRSLSALYSCMICVKEIPPRCFGDCNLHGGVGVRRILRVETLICLPVKIKTTTLVFALPADVARVLYT